MKNALVFLRGDHFLYLSPSGGNQEEQRPLDRADLFDKRHHFGQDVHVMGGNGGVDLYTQTNIQGAVQDIDSTLPGTLHFAEVIVDFGVWSVEAERDAANAGLQRFTQPLAGGQCSSCRG